jgi:hypothetical protein
MTWRKCPFEAGRSYRVRKDFRFLMFEFAVGELVQFLNDGYSRYDCATWFVLKRRSNDENCQWWLSDDSPLESWQEFFEPA